MQGAVFVHRDTGLDYPVAAPFDPSVAYPEWAGEPVGKEKNRVYDAVRELFRLAVLDAENYGTSAWNPLGRYVRPGDRVLLKPNLVKEKHPRDPQGWRYVLTHGSVIRAVCDYVVKALAGSGEIILADAPQTDSSFDKIVKLLGLDVLAEYYERRGIPFRLIDLRQEEWESRDGVVVRREKKPGDPNGAIAFDLGHRSEFIGHGGGGRYYGADYDAGEVNRHHSGGRHEYLVASTAIKCDVFINLPKLKTHKKAGITVSLKNLVGINADKNWLPHHTEGGVNEGGDERPETTLWDRMERRAVRMFQRLSLLAPSIGTFIHRRARAGGAIIFGDTEEVVRSGNWWGNDTVWRMCLDLNKIVLYGNSDGSLRTGGLTDRKRYLSIVDGIWAGEGRGPMNPDPKHCGILIFGTNPCEVDACATVLMGFDVEKIPIVRQSFLCRELPLCEGEWRDIEIICNFSPGRISLGKFPADRCERFMPHFGWVEHIERS